MLPPSNTTSGLVGHISWKAIDVVLQGDNSPGGASADQPFQSSCEITLFSVKAPTVSAFHACAGSCTGSTSLRLRCEVSIMSDGTFPALTTKRRWASASALSKYTSPCVTGSKLRPAASASTAADQDVGCPRSRWSIAVTAR